MLGRRTLQRSFFEAQSLPHRVPEDSFYGRLGAVSGKLFNDDDLAELYCLDNGRPSIPPSLLSGVLLLQFHDDVSDGEAVERMLFDMRWKVALNLPLDFPGIDPSSLSVFRQRLVEHGQERYAFDRFIQVWRAAGFISDKVTLLTDTTPAAGAGAVQDTYTLLRKGIRKTLKAMGYHLPGKRQGMSPRTQALVAAYLDQDSKADIDWSDPQRRAAQLRVLVQDADKSAFEIDLAARTITCPQGHGVTGQPARDSQGRDILKFTFQRPVCAVCPLFESHATGCTVTTHAHEAKLHEARARQATEEFKILYPTRSQVERKIAELARHGLRATRYVGARKRQLQRLWTGAAVNLKRLFTLAQDRNVDLAALLAALESPKEAAMPA